MKSISAAVAAVALVLGLMSSAEAGTRVGVLRCYMDGGTGRIIGSSQNARCIFTSDSGQREHYSSRISRIGLDLGYTGKSVIVWAVFAPSDLRHHALRGSYVGASADIAVGIGGGGNILVGGNDRTISLQPLSVKAETGLAVAVGAGNLELR